MVGCFIHFPESTADFKDREIFSTLCGCNIGRIKPWATFTIRKRLVRTVLIFTESSDQLSRATDRVPGLPASPGYVQ
ncbi:hypothetical protein HMPREF9350_05173 [Escherichia coli MS 85-1]|uniref:Uncharacterized protein n=1 Tax=Escherichia coli MS 85-1 TaxID=679202 RepID=A0AAN3M5K9_ECOLX|nr:hypothetical protein HMPREF9350_05173 [Escherichia coli MS 85-1]